jgi:aspartate oxidase
LYFVPAERRSTAFIVAREAGVLSGGEVALEVFRKVDPAIEATLDWIDAATRNVGPARALVAAKLIVSGALARLESRGGHYRSDFPKTVAPHRTFMRAGSAGEPLIHHAAMAEEKFV